MNRRSKRFTCCGFTLIELIVVIAIIVQQIQRDLMRVLAALLPLSHSRPVQPVPNQPP